MSIEAIRQHAREQRIIGFGRMLGDAKRQRRVDAAVDVGELDLERVDGCGLCQKGHLGKRDTLTRLCEAAGLAL